MLYFKLNNNKKKTTLIYQADAIKLNKLHLIFEASTKLKQNLFI